MRMNVKTVSYTHLDVYKRQAFSLAACGNSGSGDTKKSDADTSEKKEIVYGKSQGPYTELFEDAIVPILEKEGYTLKAVDLSDLQTADRCV